VLNAGAEVVENTTMAIDPTMWLAHHHDGDRHRCARVGRRPVCRRCLVLYPLLLITMVAVGAGLLNGLPVSWRNPLLWLLPLPAALEYTAEAFGRLRYDSCRQVGVTVLQAVGGGAGFAWELAEPASVSFWRAVGLYGVAAVTVTGLGWRAQANRRARARYQELLDEAERRIDQMS
jgi:hypothetical protein